jgi:hypothetical protein
VPSVLAMWSNTSLISSIAKSDICSLVITVIDWPRSSIFELRRVPDIVFDWKYPVVSATTSNGESSTKVSSDCLATAGSIGTVLGFAPGAGAAVSSVLGAGGASWASASAGVRAGTSAKTAIQRTARRDNRE